MRGFVYSYEFEGGNWMLSVHGELLEDAARRVQAIRRSAVLIGPAEKFTLSEVSIEVSGTSWNASSGT